MKGLSPLFLLAFPAALACSKPPDPPTPPTPSDRPERSNPRASTPAAARNPPKTKPGNDADRPSEQAGQPPRSIEDLVEAYFEESLERNPVQATFIGDRRYNHLLPNFLSPSYRAGERAFVRRWRAEALALDASSLSAADGITLDVFLAMLDMQLEEERFPEHLLPLSQFFSIPSFVVQLGSGTSVQPFKTVEDYESWMVRARAVVPLLDQIVMNLRAGVAAGVVQPRVLMEKALPQLAAQLVEPKESLFMRPVQNFPESVPEPERSRLTEAYRILFEQGLRPAYQRLHDFVQREYLPASRETHGYWAHPDGDGWYAFMVKKNTTTTMSPSEIHAIGLSEVERIHGEMREVMKAVGFEGTLNDFFAHVENEERFYYDEEEALLEGYRALQARVNERLPQLFDLMPKADYEVRPVEAFRAKSAAGASYMPPSPDGSRPGVFYVNTFNLKAQPKFGMETLSLHEASPGHHFQISIAQEVDSLPRFRRFGGYTAYIEGWALYAESLGRELGLYEDPMAYYGTLAAELMRAMRLVVDTGMHHQRWTRERAIEYMRSNSSMAESDVIAEVERYLALPGQALAYKVGQLTIKRLRAEAEQALGDRFDIKRFHRAILIDGALPLTVLEAKMKTWIEAEESR